MLLTLVLATLSFAGLTSLGVWVVARASESVARGKAAQAESRRPVRLVPLPPPRPLLQPKPQPQHAATRQDYERAMEMALDLREQLLVVRARRRKLNPRVEESIRAVDRRIFALRAVLKRMVGEEVAG